MLVPELTNVECHVDIARLVAADFEPRLNEEFLLRTGEGELGLRLAEVRRLGTAVREGGAFSLLFHSAPGPFLPQAIYSLTNPALGSVEIFLVPIGPGDGSNCYEAIFT
jgi:hypothetical protein